MALWRPFLISLVPSRFELNQLLQLCSNFGLIRQGRQVHQHIIVHGLDHHPFILTKLVQFYAKFGESLFAHTLFDIMPHPNVFAWTAILSLYSGNKLSSDCQKMYRKMKGMGVKPDNYIFPKVIRACSYSEDIIFGIQIHCDVITFGAEFSTEVCNSLVDMYSKIGNLESSKRVFDKIMYKDLLSWNSMISGYVFNGFHSSAVDLSSSMRSDGVEPDTVTLNTIIDAYCQMGQFDEAIKIFEKFEKPNIISWTTLMLAYSKNGKYELALKIFRDMMVKGENRPDLDCVSIVVVCCRYLNALKCGREAHAYGIKTENMIPFYKSVGPALLIMYAKCGKRIKDAGRVFDMMDKNDIVAWNAMISGFSDLGMRKMTIDCYREMHRMGISSNETTISTVLALCDLKHGKEIHSYFIKSNFASSVTVLNALINMYSKGGCIKTADFIFSKMENKDLVTWNTMITGLGNHGLGETAIQVLSNMIECGFRPDSVTFTSLLSSCSHSGLVDLGVEIFERMTVDFGIEPCIEHFASVVDLLARSGHLEDALCFVKKMSKNVEPDKRIWGALLVCSQACGNFDVIILASKNLVCLEPENAGHYVTLANSYASFGRWEDCVRVRKLMESKGLMKPSGLSWFGTD
ncbi:pentatricopeptide repeat-containing protein At1g15510, chloroplastic-like [Impatiens glandulifera]|uniref:pentatricopeptide repeat-containing protein At1g15510, chloroplastic-like n=1 Tax=Impatiens glandulifera TaxID=253017 RepID=UPI001FB13301|nr:pentatricopeptide repeat-containing protein At1g15510, chloroplastic-like [Impatiens glandulifera]